MTKEYYVFETARREKIFDTRKYSGSKWWEGKSRKTAACRKNKVGENAVTDW